MVWRTHLGNRVLEGIEAEVYLSAMQSAIDMLEVEEDLEDSDYQTGDRIFDSASFHQKIVLLYRCLQALLDPKVPAPALTNVMEAAAYLPFVFLRREVSYEIETCHEEPKEYANYFRQLLTRAYETLILPGLLHPDVLEEWGEPDQLVPESTDFEQWEMVIDRLCDRIFWDRDWQLTYSHPQLLDGVEEGLSQLTGITEEYISNRLPKVTPEEAEHARFAILRWELSSTSAELDY
jgi:hypothetical protein